MLLASSFTLRGFPGAKMAQGAQPGTWLPKEKWQRVGRGQGIVWGQETRYCCSSPPLVSEGLNCVSLAQVRQQTLGGVGGLPWDGGVVVGLAMLMVFAPCFAMCVFLRRECALLGDAGPKWASGQFPMRELCKFACV